jgi:DNA primase
MVTAIEEIKARIDIAELIGETVRLRHSGKNYTGFCPFHHNVHTPSFAVFSDSGTWRCFGACNEGGDIFRFVMKKDGVDFTEALRKLAARAGVELHPRTAEEAKAEEEHARLRTLLELAATFFRNQLLATPEGAKVLDYLHGRGFSDATLETFQVGLAPAGWDGGIAFLRGKGYSDAELVGAGLAVEGEKSGLRDRFRHRITIPIRDASGRLCGFGARIVDPNDQPKFLNSPQTALFDKGRLLFGLDRAARAMRAAGEAVLVEGYLDVMAVHQAGFENVVSPMGTALTEAQLRLLKRNARRIVLALDPDAAGNAATLRGLELARETLDRGSEPVFDARGLLRYENRLQADLRVAAMPPGRDPDEVVRENPAEWKKRIAEAQPVVLHVLHTLIQGQNLDDPKVKAMVAARMLPLIEDVGDKVERDAYRQQVARTLRVDERTLSGTVAAQRSRRFQRPAVEQGGPVPAPGKSAPREAYNIGLLLRRPDLLFRLDRSFAEIGLERITGEDFLEPGHATIIDSIREAALQGDSEPEEYLAGHVSESLSGTLDAAREALLKFHGEGPPALDEALGSMLRLRWRALERQMIDLRFYLLEIEQPPEGSDVAETVAVRKEALERMNRIGEGMDRIQRALAERTPGDGAHTTIPRRTGNEEI